MTFTITAKDAVTTQDWQVTVTIEDEPLSIETDILTFELADQPVNAIINSEVHTVISEVPFGTDVSALTTTFTLSAGASSSISSGSPVNFANPVRMTITAEDGVTTQDWVVTVTIREVITTVDEEIEFQLYPIPVIDFLQLKTKEHASIMITDMNGKVVQTELHGSDFKIDVSDLESGTYVIIIKEAEKLHYRKVIKN